MIRTATCSLAKTSLSAFRTPAHRLNSHFKHENPRVLPFVLHSTRRTFQTTSRGRASQPPPEQTSRQLKPIEEAADENFDYAVMDLPRRIQLQPIRYAIQLSQDRVEKTGSFMANLFLGKFDTDFLKYPSVLYSRKEFWVVRRQHEMVKQHFNKILGQPKCDEILYQLGFQNLWLLSKTEMVNLFEAMGASFARSYQESGKCSVTQSQRNFRVKEIHEYIFSFIISLVCHDNDDGTGRRGPVRKANLSK